MLLLLVSLSVLGLFVGALLPAIGRLRAEAEGALSGLALGMLPALVLARLLPHTFESLGPWSLVLAAVGFGMVTLSHQAGERAEARLGSALVLPALLLHAVGDGATLAMSSSGRVGSAGGLLAAAAILHRVPEGLFIASRKKHADVKGALTAVLPLALATLAGALSGQRLFEVLPDSALDGVLALGAGAMLRMLSHTHEHAETPTARAAAQAFAGVGFLVGLCVVLAVPGPHDVLQSAQPREFSVAASLLPLFVECAPALLLGLVVSATLRAWSGREVERASGRRRDFVELAKSGVGMLLGVESLALSVRLLGVGVSVARVAGGAVLVGIAAALATAAAPKHARAEVSQGHGLAHAHASDSPSARFVGAFRDLLDQVGAAFCLGLLAAAALEAAVAPQWSSELGQPWHVPLAAAGAVLCQMSALAATPVAAVLLHKGASVGAGLTFLWLTPLLQPALLSWVSRRLQLRAAVVFGVSAVLTGIGLGFAASDSLSTLSVPQVHPLIAHEHALWELACALLLGVLLLGSLLRLGPRGFAAGLRAGTPAQKPRAHSHAATHHHHAFEAP